MPVNRFKNLSTEDLVELLLLATKHLRDAVDEKASSAEIIAKRKEIQIIQNAIFARTSQRHLK